MKLHLKNLKYAVGAISMAVIFSGCGNRVVPDELVLIKYNPLEIPSTLSLPTPNQNATYLGYKTARNQISQIVNKKSVSSVQSTGDTQSAASAPSPEMLKQLQLSSVDMQISAFLQKPLGQRVVVIIDEEQARLAKNIADNAPLTTGEVPKILAKKTRAGIDELFGD